jgi:hypothetical protein
MQENCMREICFSNPKYVKKSCIIGYVDEIYNAMRTAHGASTHSSREISMRVTLRFLRESGG